MNLGEFLNKELILPELQASTKPEALAELIAPIGRLLPHFDLDKAYRVLLDRERLGSTGIGDGVAIPHGKMDNLDHIVLVAGRSRGGVDFEALDFKPCHIFFLVLAPEQVAGMHLRILAHISRLMKDEGFRASYLEAAGTDDLWRLLQQT